MGKRSTEIGNELMRLLDQQTEFLSKTAPTPEEVGEYERWLERTRELFAELEGFGVRHDDPDVRNVTYRQSDGRFCVIDFEFATILPDAK